MSLPARAEASAGLPRRQPDVTRQTLLQCAFEQIHRSGFRAASLDAILDSSGVTKGALYHHFASKRELGLAVIDEMVRPWIEETWRPLLDADDPVDGAILLCRELTRVRSGQDSGCPLNNLIIEMSTVDEGFRARLQSILDDWREGIVAAFAAGQRRGQVRADAEPQAIAAFLIGAAEGLVGLAKAKQSLDFLEAGVRGLIDYLEHLRA